MDSAIKRNGTTCDGKHLKLPLSENNSKQNSRRKTRLCRHRHPHTHSASPTSYYKIVQQFCHTQTQEKCAYCTGKENELTLSTWFWAVYKTLCYFLKQLWSKLLPTAFYYVEFRSHKFIQSAWGQRMIACYPYHPSQTTLLTLKDCCGIQWGKGRGQTCCAVP